MFYINFERFLNKIYLLIDVIKGHRRPCYFGLTNEWMGWDVTRQGGMGWDRIERDGLVHNGVG